MRWWLCLLLVLCGCTSSDGQATGEPTSSPLVVVVAEKEVRVAGVIYPTRFNSAQGEEAHYHLLVWQGGTSAKALIETAADDLAFHDALQQLGAQPGDNLTMEAWTKRHDTSNLASHTKVTGSQLEVHLSWQSNLAGVSLDRVFPQSAIRNPQSAIESRFGGNRARWFNQIPLAPRPGCLACLYSCPSGKVSNGALSIRDYVTSPPRFQADTEVLPPDGTPVIVTFRLLP